MAFFDKDHVMIKGATIVWDGITRPDQAPDGATAYSLKVVVPPQCPDLQDMHTLANQKLQESEFKGTLPSGGRMPVGQAGPGEFNGQFNGWAVLNCNSRRVPDVYDEQGQRLDPMQYGPLLYGGQRVDVLVHCYAYNKMGNKGVACGLDGFAVIASAQAPRQEFGGNGVDTAAAFGGQAPAQQQPQHAPAQQAHDMLPGGPSAAPAPAPGPGPAPAPAPGPAAEPRYTYNGRTYTEAQLKAGGWTDQQIATLPQA